MGIKATISSRYPPIVASVYPQQSLRVTLRQTFGIDNILVKLAKNSWKLNILVEFQILDSGTVHVIVNE